MDTFSEYTAVLLPFNRPRF